jgi:hypothetical protein
MELLHRTHRALEATRRLEAALRSGDLVRSAALLEERESALAAFAETHRRAAPEEIADCRGTIDDLLAADEALCRCAEARHEAAARDLERAPRGPGDDGVPLTACLDRRA